MKIQGVIVPLITPFKDGKVDIKSYEKMINHYIKQGVNGFIPLATTGESPTVSSSEYEEILEKTIEINNKRVPIYAGLGGNNTRDLINKVKVVEKYDVNGILSVTPYYSKPSQKGIFEHFRSLSEATDLNIVVYNIPYRTGVNIENETIYKLAELDNLVGIKDCCANLKQTTDLLLNPPKDFSILTGEDVLFYNTLLLGGDGGIMASAHLRTNDFIKVYNLIKSNNHVEALKIWKELYRFIPLLFKEPNPAPVKYCLMKQGLIDSDEVRLPLTTISGELKVELDNLIK
ncbi:MAG: 4-hydroxy-tetrahydrodipicolinate synthase [Clostridium butyricum]|nr:4-hydroxy-tetrahydrodipicolinate synthase [Clostridium butyricum]